MTAKPTLRVLNGSSEEIDALNASLALAGLDRRTLRILPILARRKSDPKASNDKDTEENERDKLDVPTRMADVIVEILKEQGECHPADLMDKGFTLDKIARHWNMAQALVAVVFAEIDEEDKFISSLLIA
jgi:hypothetical protein